ncbi:BA75_00081T0 [Komagataella pastoris]|uniref:BA75_00081T0 n=1 Tax=Komagataella pastoris TaxID=4922 RepID=A0A1B2J750_PICPA|nr:BA75_00081T0 [Komagataella pastoris]
MSIFRRRKKEGSDKGSLPAYGTLEEKADDDEVSKNIDELDPRIAGILKDQIKVEPYDASLVDLYGMLQGWEYYLAMAAYVCSIAAGAALPLMTLIVGDMAQQFTDFSVGFYSDSQFMDKIEENALYFVYLGVGLLVFSYFSTLLHIVVSEIIASRIKEKLIWSILHQNMAYLDSIGSGEITSSISSDSQLIQQGVSEKIGLAVQSTATVISALVLAFIIYWKLALILLSVTAAFVLFSTPTSSAVMKAYTGALASYGKASSVAEEAFSAIKTATAFGAHEFQLQKYDQLILESKSYGTTKAISMALMLGCLWFVIFANYALAFWQGSRFMVSDDSGIRKILTACMAMLFGSATIGFITVSLKYVTVGIGAASKLFAIINRKPYFDSASNAGEKIEQFDGSISFRNVSTRYPTRPNIAVLSDFTLDIRPGQTVALVGESGSGKSTVIALLERFYEYLDGDILLDGVDLKSLNIKWVRQQMALVQQEPVLFGTSIYENVCYGLVGSKYEKVSEEVKRELVEKACKDANAWEFISQMSNGLDTQVGERGLSLSGGQKQRIAIARAIISEPKILLLDEATSALDTRSEGIVQEALNRLGKTRTTIVIAHRLSTIQNADLIVVLSKGKIVETGSHKELLKKKGKYHQLVEIQNIRNRISNSRSQAPISLSNSSDLDSVSHKIDRVESLIYERAPAGTIDESAKDEQSILQLFFMLLKINEGDYHLMIPFLFFAIVAGMGYPSLSLLMGPIIEAFQVSGPQDYPHMRSQINKYSGFLFMVGCVLLIDYFVLISFMILSSERLVYKMRYRCFKQYLRQDMTFFDQPENKVGILVATLAKDPQDIEGLSGGTTAQLTVSVVTVIAGIILSVSINWRLGLVCTATIPILLGCGFFSIHLQNLFEERCLKSYQNSASYACEQVSALRTVISLTREWGVYEKYRSSIRNQVKRSRKSVVKTAFLYALIQGMTPWIFALGFWYGSRLMLEGRCTTREFFTVLMAILFGTQTAGEFFSYAPGMGMAKQAAINIKRILGTRPKSIDIESEDGAKVNPLDVKGEVELRNVTFRYPTRLEVPVLIDLNLVIKPGQYVGLVGASGCGKSTTIGLIERFYDPESGQVLLDGKDIRDLHLRSYREVLALVQQEPVLFSGSIRDNITVGSVTEVSEEDIMEACKEANIYDFISSLPEGLNTLCGNKGTMLSGGQKQRVAIARALIRNPRVLLLDEATSALDSESERAVQDAIDKASKGRTTISIAHRLSTVQNCDMIYVFEAGKIIESGKHDELLNLKGKYYDLVQLQELNP